MHLTRIFRTIIPLALLAAVHAAPVRALTLAEAVDYAMSHNPDILASRENINERRGQVVEARADAFPQLDVGLNAYRVRDPGFLNSTFGQQLLKGETGDGDGEQPPIPIEALLPKPQSYYDITLNFSQPLFTWGKVSNAWKLAKMGIRESDMGLELTRQQVAYDVSAAYYEVLRSEETIEMYEQSIRTQEEYLRQVRDFFEVGDGTRLDVLRAESNLANTRPQLMQARYDLTQARKNLNFLMGRSLDTEIATSPVEADPDYEPPALERVVDEALANRPDFRQIGLQVDMYDKTINVMQADYRPRADLVGHYGYSTINTDDLFDRNYESWRIALQVSVPVFDGLRTHGVVSQYKAQQNRTEILKSKLAHQIELEALQAVDACRSAAEVYQGRRVARESAEEEERVTSDQFDQGLVTLYELLDANRRAVEARTEAIGARYSLLREISALKKTMGVPVDELFIN